MPTKTGKLTNWEKAYIQDNYGRMTVEEIAKKLQCAVARIEKYLQTNGEVKVPNTEAERERITIRDELRATETWKRLKDEFIPEELKYFEENYIKLMSQFKGDVLPTEETQIFQLIKFEILMSRNLVARQRALGDIARLEKMQEEYIAQSGGETSLMTDDQKDFLMNLETQLQAAKAAEQSRTGEYVKLQERHDALMKTMKATRDQRIKQIESGKVSFLGVLKMLQDREIQEHEGKFAELVSMAANKEHQRLGRPHTYEDGNQDSPILSADTVNLGPEEEEENDE